MLETEAVCAQVCTSIRMDAAEAKASWGTAMAMADFGSFLNCLSPVFFIDPAIDAGHTKLTLMRASNK
jgi:hypothetical protein